MPALEEGQIFERYRIVRWLGSGVSGESYEAEDTILFRKVTLKLIHPWVRLSESARRQFFREMQGISILNQPYLASVLDYGEIDGRLYVARRYVSGGSLLGSEGRLWFRPPFSLSEAIQYGHQLAQALQHIHNQGYLHGSLTFSNILVLRGPNVENEPNFAPFLLADVGLTNFVRRFGQPQTSLLPITAAPEQLGKRVTPASDQFALAVLLYFWLTGRPPYLGSPEEIEHLKLTETIVPLDSLNPNVTSEQETALRQALAVYPEERYPSVLAFADALLATLAPPSESTPQIEAISEPEPASQAELVPQAESVAIPASESVSEPEPVLQVEPPSIPAPTPTPQPAPGPLPQPAPEPAPQPAPEPLPQPAPEPLPQPAPDIPQPVPQPAPEPPTPQGELAVEVVSPVQQELPHTQDLQTGTSARLIITSPYTEESREVILQQDVITLGRAGFSDILLEDALTSRHHAMLRREDDHYVLSDRRSATGVFVNGQKLSDETRHVLADGDRIGIGNFELSFHLSALQATDETDHISSEAATPLTW